MGSRVTFGSALKRIFAVLWIAFLPIPFPSYAQSDSHKVLVVSSNNGGIYRQVTEAIHKVIANNASTNTDLSFIDLENTSHIGDLSTLSQDYDLVVSVGLDATRSMSALERHPPLLATLIPLQAAESLLNSFPKSVEDSRHWVSAIVLDQPLERELGLIKQIAIGTKSVGILLSPSSAYSVEQIGKLAKRFDLAIYTEMVTPGENLIRELGYILDKAEILLAIPDPLIFNRQTAGKILQSAYRRRVPVIGFASAYVKAGALAAVYSSPAQIGRHTGESILDYFSKDKKEFPTIQYPRYFSVAFNRQVERSLGLTLPRESAVEKAIQSLEKTTP